MGNKLHFKDSSAYNEYMSKVDQKIRDGESLSKEEIDTFCFALPYAEKKKHDFCDDDRFNYLYIASVDPEKTITLTQDQKDDFALFLNNWKTFVKKHDHKNEPDNYISREYRSEVKNLNKDFKSSDGDPTKNEDYNQRLKEILAYNKYIYLKGKDIFPNIELPFIFTLSGKRIVLNENVFFHSLMRHYGKFVKQTSVKKSYFTEDILIEDLIDKLNYFLTTICSNISTFENIYSFRIKFKSNYYQIYNKAIKERGEITAFMVNTFYPIEDKSIIASIETDYKEFSLFHKV